MEEQHRKEIGKFYLDNQDKGKKFVVDHFLAKKFSKSYIYKIINRVVKGSPMQMKPKTGRPKIVLSPKTRKSWRREVVGKVAKSYRCLGQKFGRHHKTVKRILEDMGINKKKRKVIPKSSATQRERQTERLNKATKGVLRPRNGLDVVMDDESYFPFAYFADQEYYFEGRKEVSRDVKFKQKEKYVPKVLVWIAISSKGRSVAFVAPSRMNINAEVYQNECIRQRLLPFVQEMYPNGDYIFWPDLASSHYAKKTLETLNELGIPVVPKDQNLPAAPEIRPIERFWRHLKVKVYKDGWEAQNVQQIIDRILEKLETFDVQYFHDLMRSVKSKVRKASIEGLDSLR